jgi:hypothetical protein
MKTNTYRSILSALALGTTLLLGSHQSATAQAGAYTFFPNNATINYTLPAWSTFNSQPVYETAIVGYANFNNWTSQINGTSPTINVVAGAYIGSGLYTFNSSVVNISGGTVGGGGVFACDTSTVNLTGGLQPGGATTYYGGTINVYNGCSPGYLAAQGGTVNVYGGSIGSRGIDAFAIDYGTMNIYGGTFVSGQIYIYNGATLNVYGNLGHLGFKWLGNRLVPVYFPAHIVTATLVNKNANGPPGSYGIGGYTEYTLKGSLSDGTNVTGVQVLVTNGGPSNFFNVYW